MGKKKKEKKDKEKKGLKDTCCEKYLKKGEHKRCKRCPCFDMTQQSKEQRFKAIGVFLKE